jgi:hypothetical protein
MYVIGIVLQCGAARSQVSTVAVIRKPIATDEFLVCTSRFHRNNISVSNIG